jgi:hypothetical protein
MREIAVRLFDKQGVPELARIAQECEIVGAPPLPFNIAGKTQPHLRLADEIKRDIGERNVFLERGRMAAPGADALRENERIVAHPESEFEENGVGFDDSRHMCPTSSGMS